MCLRQGRAEENMLREQGGKWYNSRKIVTIHSSAVHSNKMHRNMPYRSYFAPTAPDFHTLYAYGVQKTHENASRDSGCE